jgi:uncharacterized secreted protein with C-terminal beta-propeller domain
MLFRSLGLVAVLATQIFGCGLHTEPTESFNNEKLPFAGDRTFKDCRELARYIEIEQHRLKIPKIPGIFDTQVMHGATSGDSINFDGQTNLQEAGVDEADAIKISKDAIFDLREKDVVILDRATRTVRGTLPFEASSRAELYATENKLLIITANANREGVDVSSIT